MDHSRLRRIKDVLAPVLLVVLPLCLFGPHAIYSGNEAEFTAPFWLIVRTLLLAGAGIALALVALGLALPGRVFRAYVALLFGLGLVVWIQGNFLQPDYAAFTGAEIDWTAESWRNPYEMTLWAALPLLCVVASKYVFPIAPFASGALVALQAAWLVTSSVGATASARPEWEGPAEGMFDLSRSRNAIHIVLDGFQSEMFHEILEEDREALDRSWSGATFYADHLGAFPSTIVSIPAMLTGTVYRNERNLQRYIRDHFEKGSLFKALRAGGFRVDSVTGMQYDNRSATHFFRVPRPYVSYPEYVEFAAWQLADMSLFRHAPHILRPKIHNGEAWRLQSMLGPGDTRSRRLHSVNGAVVLAELTGRVRVATDEPLYKFIHVGIPHLPVAVDADCSFIGTVRATREHYKAQARCAVRRVSALLDRMKELGVYDNSLVVISSDHGNGFRPVKFVHDRQLPAGALSSVAGRSMALLIVKAPGQTGPVRVSYAPTAITDIPATVLDAMGVKHDLPGASVLGLAEDAARPRVFTMYDWEHDDWGQQYFEALDVMEVRGRLLDGNSWTPVAAIYSPEATDEARLRGLYDLQRSRSGVEYRWSMPQAFLHVPPDARAFEIKIRSIAPTPQTVTVAYGDREIDKRTLADQSWVTLRHALPASATPDMRWVHLTVDPPWRPRGERRTLGVQTRDLKWEP
jgi:hypothetical protein